MNNENSKSFLERLWIYQSERFPIFKHGIVIASFSFSAVSLSALLRGDKTFPDLQTALTAFICLFLFFLELRIIDEFKDHEDDLKYRPNRPVPRGLISFNELKIILLFAIITQIITLFLLNSSLLVFFVIVLAYMGLMSVEFFASRWLKNKIFTYMWTHMLIMPLIDLFATACDWLQYSSNPPKGLIWFLIISFFNGCIIEIGRKTWAPDQEIKGVDSYSSNWGLKTSIYTWLILVLISIIIGIIVSSYINFILITSITLIILSFIGMIICYQFMKNQNKSWAAKLENFSGIWVAAVYFILGVVPMTIFSSGGFKL